MDTLIFWLAVYLGFRAGKLVPGVGIEPARIAFASILTSVHRGDAAAAPRWQGDLDAMGSAKQRLQELGKARLEVQQPDPGRADRDAAHSHSGDAAQHVAPLLTLVCTEVTRRR